METSLQRKFWLFTGQEERFASTRINVEVTSILQSGKTVKTIADSVGALTGLVDSQMYRRGRPATW